jgi:hypothetical protein
MKLQVLYKFKGKISMQETLLEFGLFKNQNGNYSISLQRRKQFWKRFEVFMAVMIQTEFFWAVIVLW